MTWDEGEGYDVFGMSEVALARAVALSRPIYRGYFRVRSHGVEGVPAAGPTIVVANHGGALPVDAVLLSLDLGQRTRPRRVPRPIVDRFVPLVPFINTLFARLGAVSGTRANVRRLLARGELIVIWPEGVTGMAKPVSRRYQLQDWRVGHAELALRHRAVLVPAAVIGAEESWPVVGRARWFHMFGAPFLPVPATPIPLPVRYDIYYGEPIAAGVMGPPEAADDPRAVSQLAALTRGAVERLLAEGRAARGRGPGWRRGAAWRRGAGWRRGDGHEEEGR